MGIKKIILILSIFLLFSCEDDKTIGLKNNNWIKELL